MVDLELKDCQNALESYEKDLAESEEKLQQKNDESVALTKQLLEKNNEIGIVFCAHDFSDCG